MGASGSVILGSRKQLVSGGSTAQLAGWRGRGKLDVPSIRVPVPCREGTRTCLVSVLIVHLWMCKFLLLLYGEVMQNKAAD